MSADTTNLLANVHETPYVSGNLFGTSITMKDSGFVDVFVATSADVIAYLWNGTTAIALNGGVSLGVDQGKSFGFAYVGGQAFNIRFSGAATVRDCVLLKTR
jgi:hypothetical protein